MRPAPGSTVHMRESFVLRFDRPLAAGAEKRSVLRFRYVDSSLPFLADPFRTVHASFGADRSELIVEPPEMLAGTTVAVTFGDALLGADGAALPEPLRSSALEFHVEELPP